MSVDVERLYKIIQLGAAVIEEALRLLTRANGIVDDPDELIRRLKKYQAALNDERTRWLQAGAQWN